MRINTHARIERLFLVALAAAMIALPGCSSTKPADSQVSDAWIVSKVETKLAADPATNNFEVDVDATDGVVRLSGTVETDEARAAAVRLAENTRGVTSVVDEIGIGDPRLDENVTDAWIVSKIKSKLAADPEINPFNIDVDAVRGVVTLSGTVAKELARDEAERHARTTRGVTDVDNRIRIEIAS